LVSISKMNDDHNNKEKKLLERLIAHNEKRPTDFCFSVSGGRKGD